MDALVGVTEAYGRGGVPAGNPSSAGVREPWLMGFGETVEWGLVPFLKTLTAELAPTVAPAGAGGPSGRPQR